MKSPLPGGLSRRDLLRAGVALPAVAALPLPFARAAGLAPADPQGRVLVVVQLTGGNDGLNTVVPWADDRYHRARPVLAVPEAQVVRLTDDTGLHPALAALRPVWDEGRLAVWRGVGPPRTDRSHFRSMEVWHTASLDEPAPTTGWVGALARAADGQGSLPVVRAGGRDLPLALAGAPSQAPALASLDDVLLETAGRAAAGARRARLRRACCDLEARGGQAGLLAAAFADAFDCSDRLRELHADARGDFPPGELGRGLELAALLVGARLGVRVLYVTQGGYDTHARQSGSHPDLLRELGNGLAAFDQRLAQQGDRARVAVLVFSEFGRRIRENASGGTDHGAGNPVLALGQPVLGGVHGVAPDLAGDGAGDVPVTLDFRHLYAAGLQWLEVPAADVLPGAFEPAPAFRG